MTFFPESSLLPSRSAESVVDPPSLQLATPPPAPLPQPKPAKPILKNRLAEPGPDGTW